MFGCLKTLLKIIILILAFVGFQTLGGIELVKDLWQKYYVKYQQNSAIQKQVTYEKIFKMDAGHQPGAGAVRGTAFGRL